MTTALGDALLENWILPRNNALILALTEFKMAGGDRVVAEAAIDAVFGDADKATRSLTHRVQSYRAKAIPESSRSGHIKSAAKAAPNQPERLAPKPPAASYVAAAKTAAKAVALTVLDSFRVRDGRAIGDVTFGELESLRGANAREASVIRQIQRHAANVTADAKVRDIIKASDLERMIQRGAEVADAA
jgi:hypothetical protein